jgi:hypothetical protein
MKTFAIIPSDKPEKKFFALHIDDKGEPRRIYFGDSNYDDYTTYKENAEDHKERYLMRHVKREDWDSWENPSFWSRWFLWEKKDKRDAVAYIERKFKIRIMTKWL